MPFLYNILHTYQYITLANTCTCKRFVLLRYSLNVQNLIRAKIKKLEVLKNGGDETIFNNF